VKGKVGLAAVGALTLLGVAALLSRRTDARDSSNRDGERTDSHDVPENTLTTAVDKEE
jgi:hypothetical protein